MHPNLDELLALRDGDSAADVARHVERCDQCRAELEELRATSDALRDLPSVEAPRDTWAEIRRRILGRRRRTTWTRVAIAAACLPAVAAVTLVARFGPFVGETEDAMATNSSLAIEQLSNASRQLELVLQERSLQARVLSPRQAALIVELEDRIALVDLALAHDIDNASNERSVALWSDRVELLDALVTARGGAVHADAMTFANNRNRGSQR